MLAENQKLDTLFTQSRQLSQANRLRLVQRLVQTLRPTAVSPATQPLQFGEFGGQEANMATWDDFTATEWHLTEIW